MSAGKSGPTTGIRLIKSKPMPKDAAAAASRTKSSPMRTRYLAGLSRNTVLLAFASLFADISSEMLYPILPIFLI